MSHHTGRGQRAEPQLVDFGTLSRSHVIPDEPECIIHPPFRAPDWLSDLIRANAADADIVEVLVSRLRSGQSDLHEAHSILADIGRNREGGAVAKRFVTQDIIRELS